MKAQKKHRWGNWKDSEWRIGFAQNATIVVALLALIINLVKSAVNG